jgi:peptidoglycan-N-acetylglucosamine deacetylase
MIKNALPWPNGARCAVAFTFDVDADSVVHAIHGSDALDQLHALAHMRYDPFVGLPRLVDLFSSYQIPVTYFVPGWVVDTYPTSIEYAFKSRSEVAHHGHFHEWPNKQTPADERQALESGIRSIERLTGGAPKGYRAPFYALSRRSLDLLIEAGFLYDSSLFADDVPIVFDNGRGTLIEVPVPASVDDYVQYASSRAVDGMRKISPPRHALEVYRAEFDAMWEFGGSWISVWHPAVSGRPAPVLAIRQLIEHMIDKGNVWFATVSEIAHHAQSLMAKGIWTPRIEKIPLYKQPVL